MFTRHDHLLAGPASAAHYGLAIGDIDGDGRFEVLACAQGDANQVLKWDGAALFDIADGALADPASAAVGAAFADIDGDGREEAYIVNSDAFAGQAGQPDRLFARHAGSWQDLLAQAGAQAPATRHAGRSVIALDRHGRGRYGFLVGSYGAPLKLIEPSESQRLADLAPDCGLARQASARGLLAAPLLGKAADILVSNDQGPNLFFAHCGDGHFDEQAGPAGLADGLEQGQGLALLDNGGRLDVCATNWEGPHRLWRNTPGAGFVDLAPTALAAPSRATSVVCADFDHDGCQEILVINVDEPNRLIGWREGAWRQLDPGEAGEGEAPATGATVGDIDGDGRLELLLAHGAEAPVPLSLFKARPATEAHWLRVAVRLPGGAPARGAVVTCWQDGAVQRRVIDPGSGYLGQMEPVAHFGLGRGDAAPHLAVTWPDGAQRSLAAPALDQDLVVVHPAAL